MPRTLKLAESICLEGTTYSELVFEEPRGKQRRLIGNLQTQEGIGSGDIVFGLASILCGVPVEVLDLLCFDDAGKVEEIVAEVLSGVASRPLSASPTPT